MHTTFVITTIITSCVVGLTTAFAAAGDVLTQGRGIYNRACSPCHGLDGAGDGRAAAYLDPKPRNFTRGAFKFRSTEYGAPPTDADLERTIRVGIPGTSMPGWDRKLADAEIIAVIAYLKTFSDAFDEPLDPDDQMPPSSAAPETSPQRVAEGRALFVLMQCWKCHGLEGEGDGPSSSTLVNSWDEPLEAYDFTTGVFKSGRTAQDLFRTMSVGLAGTPMPGYADSIVVPRELAQDLSRFETLLSATELDRVREASKAWPRADDLQAADEATLAELSEARRWSLVMYLQALADRSDLARYLFSNPYLTP